MLPRTVAILIALTGSCFATGSADEYFRELATSSLKKAATFFRNEVSSHGGYVNYVSLDMKHRYGEGVATADQIWVQPPGTPSVGLSYLRAYQVTGDRFYLEAARETAEALIHGQLQSGGWTAWIDFDPKGSRVAAYRNGKGKGKGRNYSSLDDGQTQTAIELIARVDHALEFEDETIHQAAKVALDALLAAQFPNGGFPQVWTQPVEDQPVVEARFPDYDWRTEGRIKEYWDLYTLNDDLAVTVTETRSAAYEIYEDKRYLQALRQLGNFLILAQLPDPQPAWAQQYNYHMIPVWARKFEPPGVSGYESQGVLRTLIRIAELTGDKKYLKPIPKALAYLKRSVLPEGKLARFYELESNRPLYMKRKGKVYSLTYDDSDLPSHYGFKVSHELDEIEAAYRDALAGEESGDKRDSLKALAERAGDAIAALDKHGRWLSKNPGKNKEFGERVISSPKFSNRFEAICDYLEAAGR